LWPSDTYVDFDHGLNKAVNRLREILGDAADNPRFVETLHKRGYRFIAPVETVVPGPARGWSDAAVAPVPAPPASPVPPPVVPDVPRSTDARRLARTGPWLFVVGAVALAGLVVGIWLARQPRGNAPARTMLAVLPFVNIAGAPDQEYFCDGMTEEMILQLSALSPDRLGVIARTSSMHYKGSAKRVDEIADELGVRYVLEGTVRRSRDRVRITARLVRRDDQTPLWSESFERDLSEVFDIQSDVARRIAGSLALELFPRDAEGARRVAYAKADAYESYLRGRYHWNKRTPGDLEQAMALLEDAIAKDPSYVPAQAALADALNVLPWYGLRPPREAYPRSKQMAQQALALDESSAAAHTALAYAYHYYDWNWREAEAEYGRALALNPNYAQAHQWLAAHLAEFGRIDAALAEMRKAQTLDPRSMIINAAIGWIQYLGRRYQPALIQLRGTIGLDPRFVPARIWLGQTLEALGRPQEAIEQYLRVREIADGAPTGLGELARGYALAGRREDAERTLAELLAIADTRYVEADLIARVYDGLGDPQRALTWLERGYDERAVKMVLLGADPQYDRLRPYPRFTRVLERIELPPRSTARRRESRSAPVPHASRAAAARALPPTP
jgi:TolB-like protein/Tfp pilus assembly protein PilF